MLLSILDIFWRVVDDSIGAMKKDVNDEKYQWVCKNWHKFAMIEG